MHKYTFVYTCWWFVSCASTANGGRIWTTIYVSGSLPTTLTIHDISRTTGTTGTSRPVTTTTVTVDAEPTALTISPGGKNYPTAFTEAEPSTTTTAAAVANLNGKELVCNNSPLLCDRTYNNVTYMGTHNGPFIRDTLTLNSLAGNQVHNTTTALSAGIRLFQTQVHLQNSVPHLCHGSCNLINAGKLYHWFSNITTWLNENQFEVVTILLVNSDSLPLSTIWQDVSASGLAQHIWRSLWGYPRPLKEWPTLRKMITTGKRVVLFMTRAVTAPDISYPHLLDEWDYIFETYWDVRQPEEFNCTAQRPTHFGKNDTGFYNASAAYAAEKGYLPLLNHFLYAPLAPGAQMMVPNVARVNFTNLPTGNTIGSLSRHATECIHQWGTKPVFVLVDFFHRQSTIILADGLNGINGKTQGRLELDEAAGGIAGAFGETCPKCSGAEGTRERRSRAGMGALVGFLVAALFLAG